MIYNMKNKDDICISEVAKASLKYDYTSPSEVPNDFKELALKVVEDINSVVLARTWHGKEVGYGKVFAAANSKPVTNSMVAGVFTATGAGAAAAKEIVSGNMPVAAVLGGVAGGSALAVAALALVRSLINRNKHAYKNIVDEKPRNKYTLVVVNDTIKDSDLTELTNFSQSIIQAVPEVLRKLGFKKTKSKDNHGDIDYTFSKKGKDGNIYLAIMDNNLRKNTSTMYLLCIKDNDENNTILNEAASDFFYKKHFKQYDDDFHKDKTFGKILLDTAKDLGDLWEYANSQEIKDFVDMNEIPSFYSMDIYGKDMTSSQLKSAVERVIKKRGFAKNTSADLAKLSQDKDVDFKNGYTDGESIEYIKKAPNNVYYVVVFTYGTHPMRFDYTTQDKRPNYTTDGKLNFYRIQLQNSKITNEFASLQLI